MIDINELNRLTKNTLVAHLGIVFTAVENGCIRATMPVDHRTQQPQQRLHGGASMALAESLGGAGSMSLIDNTKFTVLGIDINGSHVGYTTEKEVIAEAHILFQGKSTHVWDIRISDKNKQLISVCRLTNRIIPLK